MSARFNLVKRGYHTVEVEDYINNLDSIIKGYKEKDNAIRNAILNAQIAADNIIKNAKLEAADIIKRAANQVDTIIASVSVQRSMLDAFRKEYEALVTKYLVKLDDNDISRVIEKIDTLEKFLLKYSTDTIDENGDEIAPPAPAPASAPQEITPQGPFQPEL